jgi:hypothetical protein
MKHLDEQTVTGHRNYALEMRLLVERETASGPYQAATVAHRIVEHLLNNDRELLDGWLESQAVTVVSQYVARKDAATRAYTKATIKRSVFAEKANEAKKVGAAKSLASFLLAPYTTKDNIRKPLAEMTAPEVNSAAERYEATSRSAAMDAAFLRAIAKHVSKGVVADHFTDTQLAELWARVTGE